MDTATITKRIKQLEDKANLANQPTASDKIKIIESVMFQQYLDKNSELYHQYEAYALSWKTRMGDKAFNQILAEHKKSVTNYEVAEKTKKQQNERIRKQLEQLRKKTEKRINPKVNKKEIQELNQVIGRKEEATDN